MVRYLLRRVSRGEWSTGWNSFATQITKFFRVRESVREIAIGVEYLDRMCCEHSTSSPGDIIPSVTQGFPFQNSVSPLDALVTVSTVTCNNRTGDSKPLKNHELDTFFFFCAMFSNHLIVIVTLHLKSI